MLRELSRKNEYVFSRIIKFLFLCNHTDINRNAMYKSFLLYLTIITFSVLLLTSCTKDEQDSNSLVNDVQTVPVLTTDSVINITYSSAFSGGNIATNGGATITSKGICWNTSPNPTISHSNTVEETGSASFTSNLTGLSIRTTYYVRAYATNSVGTAYGQEVSFSTDSSLYIGVNYAGGVVFYLDTSNIHGLVSANSDAGTSIPWGCPNSQIPGADGTSIGTGKQNTIDIVNGCATSTGFAAALCDSFILNGYSDWFLPSKAELDSMYNKLFLNGVGNFSNNAYWSSSEMTSVFAWQVFFSNGIKQGTNKINLAAVRAVRKF